MGKNKKKVYTDSKSQETEVVRRDLDNFLVGKKCTFFPRNEMPESIKREEAKSRFVNL